MPASECDDQVNLLGVGQAVVFFGFNLRDERAVLFNKRADLVEGRVGSGFASIGDEDNSARHA